MRRPPWPGSAGSGVPPVAERRSSGIAAARPRAALQPRASNNEPGCRADRTCDRSPTAAAGGRTALRPRRRGLAKSPAGPRYQAERRFHRQTDEAPSIASPLEPLPRWAPACGSKASPVATVKPGATPMMPLQRGIAKSIGRSSRRGRGRPGDSRPWAGCRRAARCSRPDRRPQRTAGKPLTRAGRSGAGPPNRRHPFRQPDAPARAGGS